MNRTIALLILGVILLAMALIMVNQYMTQPGDTAATATAPLASAPNVSGTPQAASPEAVLSQLEQRASTSELAPREPAAPPRPQTMPAWASNQGLTPPPAPSAQSGMPAAQPAEPTSGVSTQGTPPAASPLPDKTPAPTAATAAPATAAPQAAQPASAASSVTPAKPEQKAAQAKPKEQSPPAEQAKPKPKGPKTIKKIAVIRMDDEVAVRLDGSEPLVYKTMHLKAPERVVVDLEGQWAIKAPGVPENKYVSNVRIGKQGDKTRIVIDLRQTPQGVRYVKRSAEELDVRIK